jgi:hypothetical protein
MLAPRGGTLSGKVGFNSGGYVGLELVEPVPKYGGCSQNAVAEVPVPLNRPVG